MKKVLLYFVVSILLLIAAHSNAQTITSHSVDVIDTSCSGAAFSIRSSSYSSTLFAKTYYGDGTYSWTPMLNGGSYGYATIIHPYSTSGTYQIKQYLYNGTTTALDSISESFTYLFCRSIYLQFYDDINANNVYDAGTDILFQSPLQVEVDSAGVIIDTLTTNSGLYYKEQGMAGVVYSFKLLSHTAGIVASAPSSGIFTDTLSSGSYNPLKYFGVRCTGTGVDVAEYIGALAGRHAFYANIQVNNDYCAPAATTLTMHFSPKYNFSHANPTPTSISGHTLTWNLTGLSLEAGPQNVQVTLEVTGTWLTPGDTMLTDYTLSSPTGDGDVENNHCVRVDTIKESWDPNNLSVSPEGFILAGTKLTYNINFENTGNDTAFNIHVLDTLSDDVDPASLQIIAASAKMNVSRYIDGGHNVVNFDFPHINLLDSSHHGFCDGMVRLSVATRSDLPIGTHIDNEAGIYFDYNQVVMTNMTENTVADPAAVGSVSRNTTSVSIFPNPATDEITIKTEDRTYTGITISDALGRHIVSQQLTGIQTRIDVQALPTGIYFATVIGQSDVKVVKFEKH